MSKVELSEDAEIDLSDIWTYVAHDSPAHAGKLLARMHDTCHRLARTPEIGRDRSDLAPKLRSFPLATFVIFYRRMRGGIEIVRVLSGFRDMSAVFAYAR